MQLTFVKFEILLYYSTLITTTIYSYLKVIPPDGLEDGQAKVKSRLEVGVVHVAQLALDEPEDVVVVLLTHQQLKKWEVVSINAAHVWCTITSCSSPSHSNNNNNMSGVLSQTLTVVLSKQAATRVPSILRNALTRLGRIPLNLVPPSGCASRTVMATGIRLQTRELSTIGW